LWKSIAAEAAPAVGRKRHFVGGCLRPMLFCGLRRRASRLKPLLQRSGNAGAVIEARVIGLAFCRRVFTPDAFLRIAGKSIAAEAAPTTERKRGGGDRNPRHRIGPLWKSIAAEAAPTVGRRRLFVGGCLRPMLFCGLANSIAAEAAPTTKR
jgi:hypothetical protein